MMSGEGAHVRPPLANPDPRVNSSPLQIFVKAKRRINDIFVEIDDYVLDAVAYIKSKLFEDFEIVFVVVETLITILLFGLLLLHINIVNKFVILIKNNDNLENNYMFFSHKFIRVHITI